MSTRDATHGQSQCPHPCANVNCREQCASLRSLREASADTVMQLVDGLSENRTTVMSHQLNYAAVDNLIFTELGSRGQSWFRAVVVKLEIGG